MRRKRDDNEEALVERAQKKMLELNRDEEFYDFKFTVCNESFFVSKLVLSAVSPYFAKKFAAEWKFKASVDLKEKHGIEAFTSMIEYIYTYTYEERTLMDFAAIELVDIYFELYHMAEEYEIPGLKERVLEDVPPAVKDLNRPEEFFDLVEGKYMSDSELGKVFLAAVADNVHKMEAFKDIDKMKELLPGIPCFAGDLSCELIKRRMLNGEGDNV